MEVEERGKLSRAPNFNVSKQEEELYEAHDDVHKIPLLRTVRDTRREACTSVFKHSFGVDEEDFDKKNPSRRLASLDVFRGLTIAVMILVDDAGGAWPNINHSPWHGVTLADYVMPFFLFIVGMSLVLAFKNQNQNQRSSSNRSRPFAGLVPDTLGSADADASSELCRAWGQVGDHQSLVFFDPGARANFITPLLAEKMGIKMDEMGPAYTASMAAPRHEVAVTPLIGKLRLHIQGYVGHEEFYIMPLEGCVLLGMPWFYNHKAVLDSSNKTVTLEIRERDETESSNFFSLDVSRRAFLEEYADCFLPGQLPPERSEDHNIDLILGSAAPNKPPYRVNAAQQEEIMTQNTRNKPDAFQKAALRALKLFVLGVFLQGGYLHGRDNLNFGVDMQNLRIMGILQRISIGYLLVACCEILSKGIGSERISKKKLPSFEVDARRSMGMYPWHWAFVMAISFIYLGVLYGLRVPDWHFKLVVSNQFTSTMESTFATINCDVRGDLGPACNAVGFLDRTLVGISHLYPNPVYRRTKVSSSCR
ncbi:hypothetical protein L7F22_066778 [Adiantum nelumboides]|nr:hypothetical protein [Adiantum nelumboides]